MIYFGLGLPLMAWNSEGHMIVAQIAYDHLDPAVRAKCDALIAVPLTYQGSSTSSFVTAACWADDYKGQLGTGTWHYIDLPISLDGTSFENFVPPAFDVVQAINLCVATLRSDTANAADQARSLRYLIHFVGDIQQPLHCTAAFFASKPNGDAGGNGFYLSGVWSNLHFLWDDGGGFLLSNPSRPLTAQYLALQTSKISAIERLHPYTRNAGWIPNPMDWALAGKELAATTCYPGVILNTTPTSEYLSLVREVTLMKLALGGHRLANLLNTIFAVKVTPVMLQDNTFGFSWNSVPGHTYQIQWADSLAQPVWMPLVAIIAEGDTATFSEVVADSRRFYRVSK